MSGLREQLDSSPDNRGCNRSTVPIQYILFATISNVNPTGVRSDQRCDGGGVREAYAGQRHQGAVVRARSIDRAGGEREWRTQTCSPR